LHFDGSARISRTLSKADWWWEISNANYLRTGVDVVEDPDITSNDIDLIVGTL